MTNIKTYAEQFITLDCFYRSDTQTKSRCQNRVHFPKNIQLKDLGLFSVVNGAREKYSDFNKVIKNTVYQQSSSQQFKYKNTALLSRR